MAEKTVHYILEQIKTLDLNELLQVSRAVQERLVSQAEVLKRQASHQALIGSGLVRQIRIPLPPQDSKRRLVQVKGHPVSQTIIEERR
jgi:hypothetical protein